MKKSLIALALVAGCGASDREPANRAATAGEAPVAAEAGDRPEAEGQSAAAAPAGPLTGLYEGGSGPQRSQLCIVDRNKGSAQFGLIVWGSNMHSCSGAGTAVRSGERLTLTMGGDSSCTIEATMKGGTVTLPSNLPAGCSYYCGARAQMSGASFARTGSSTADAMKAKDLAGDSLCEGSGG
jgi:hypothetical protein